MATATVLEPLYARKKMIYKGQHFGPGDRILPDPEGRLRRQLIDGNFVYALTNTAPVAASVGPEGLHCPSCERVFTSPHGLKVHQGRLHPGG